MNDYGRRYLIEQMNRHDERRGGRGRRRRDMEDDYEDYEDCDDYAEDDYYDQMDSRRGVRGSGRGRGRGRDRRDMEDMRDYHEQDMPKMKLTKVDMNHWKHSMHNTDGTTGEHYDMQQIMHAADKLGVKFRDFDEKDFCIAVNMMYSDYGHIIKRLAAGDKDKELLICADFAKAYLDDPDGVDAKEKLAVQYHCMVDV
jgi:hypothetical protein